MKLGFSLAGFLVFLLPMLINIVYFALPPVDEIQQKQVNEMQQEKRNATENHILTMIEQGSRIAYAAAVCVLVSKRTISNKSIFLYIAILFLILYYTVWIRYFIGGRKLELLGKSFLGIPMPLAVFPVIYFLFAALWLHNYYAFGFMILFGIAHNVISYQTLYCK